MLPAVMLARHTARRPAPLGYLLAALAAFSVGWFVLYAVGKATGAIGVLATLAALSVAVGWLCTRRMRAEARQRAHQLAAFDPRVRAVVHALCGPVHVQLAALGAARLPALHIHPHVYPTATGGALLRVSLPRGLRLAHLTAAAPWLAASWGVPVTVTPDQHDRRAAVLEIHPAPR